VKCPSSSALRASLTSKVRTKHSALVCSLQRKEEEEEEENQVLDN